MVVTCCFNRLIFKTYLSIVVLAAFLTGCSTPIKMTGLATENISPYVERQDAVGTLLNHAWDAHQQGLLNEAESYLNRALRISPTTPDIYYQLALLRQDQRLPEQSRQLAERALSLYP
ncbi:MAG: hypothetical protein ACPGEF_02610, partial [Endozoicomonas sp.]